MKPLFILFLCWMAFTLLEARALDERGDPLPSTQQSDLGVEPNPILRNEPTRDQSKPLQVQTRYEQALDALRSGNKAQGLKLLEEASMEQGEDGKTARIRLLRERAADGYINQGLQEEDGAALLALADGYRECHLRNPKETKCLTAEKQTLLQAATGDQNDTTLQARVRYSGLLLDEGFFTEARNALLPIFQGATSQKVPFDLAWFYLAQALELDPHQRDPYRAFRAYQQVIDFPNSAYAEVASKRQHYLRRYYLGPSFQGVIDIK